MSLTFKNKWITKYANLQLDVDMFIAKVHCTVETTYMKNSSVCSLITTTTNPKTVVQYKTRDEHKRKLSVKTSVDNRNLSKKSQNLSYNSFF